MSALMNELPEGIGYLLNQVGRYPLLTAAEELTLGRIIQGNEPGKLEAIQKLVLHNIRLVINISKSYSCDGLDQNDIIQEGVFGLYRAAEKFDPARKMKFSTYATWWIKQSIGRGMHQGADLIRLPEHMHQTLFKIKKTIRQLVVIFDREPTIEEISKHTKLSLHQVIKAMSVRPMLLTLDDVMPGMEKGDMTKLEGVTYEGIAEVESEAHQRSLKKALAELLGKLPWKEAEVIRMRYGIEGRSQTLEEVAEAFGVTRERIRQIQVRAERRLRNKWETKNLKVYLEEV